MNVNKCMKQFSTPKSSSSLTTWVHYLESLKKKSMGFDLDQIRQIATDLSLLQPAPKIIIVGGTNGKGTTCRLLEVIFLYAGIRVGVYSSPHLLRYTERVRIQGKELSEAAHSSAMSIIADSCKQQSLSYFEFGTLEAFLLFKQSRLDIVILEVGLGGRLDATNIVDADISVITTIALDHTDYFGTNRSDIAREKAGIFRPGKPAVIGEPDRPMTLDVAALDSGAKLYACDRDWWWKTDGNQWCWWDRKLKLSGLPLPIVPLNNAATVLAVIRHLPFSISKAAIYQGLCNADLPGRFQCIHQSPMTILDVAHNPHAASYLANRLMMQVCTGTVRAVVGMLKDKDIAGTLSCLRRYVHVWYCASLDGPRAASASQLAIHLDNKARKFKNIESAWNQAMMDSFSEDCILVFGSFYTVALVMTLIKLGKI